MNEHVENSFSSWDSISDDVSGMVHTRVEVHRIDLEMSRLVE